TVTERPVIAKVSIEGNSAIEKSKLEPLIRLKPRARYTPAQAHTDALRIRDYYRSQGRLMTSVDPKVSNQADGQVEVAFIVKEADVTKVDRISFVGNRAFSERQLRDVITTSQSGWFDILKTAAFYDAERIKQDRDLLRRHYLKNGFPDARVVAVDAQKNEQGTGYSVQFTVEEGERYTFRSAAIKTNVAKIDTAELQSSILIRPGAAFSQEQIDKSVEKMTLALSDQGYASLQVRPMPVRNTASRTIGIGF